MLTFGSVCSGIEAASVAWEPLGFKPLWFSEIESFPCAVLDYHWPHIPNLGDMTLIHEKITSGDVSPPDILVGGTPCQSFSIAGTREGLSDSRGQLSLSYIQLADIIDEKRKELGKPESIIVWENVPGVLSSKDNAFGQFIGKLAGESEALRGDCSMLNISESPKDVVDCSLSQVLETGLIHEKYYLSAKACAGILRRAEQRGIKLPDELYLSLQVVNQ